MRSYDWLKSKTLPRAGVLDLFTFIQNWILCIDKVSLCRESLTYKSLKAFVNFETALTPYALRSADLAEIVIVSELLQISCIFDIGGFSSVPIFNQ